MKKMVIALLCLGGILESAQTPSEGLKRLQEGNQRFVNEALIHPRRDEERRLTLSEGQMPFAVIVSCSDSRVVPEVIFDEGLGDLFVIRVAGNVIGATERESVEFAIRSFKPVVILVMGHEKCGAIDAVMQGNIENIPAVSRLIAPAVSQAPHHTLKEVIEINACRMSALLLESPLIAEKVQAKELEIRSAYYDLQTGKVHILE